MRGKINNKGLTLVEIIITLAVLGIVITPLMSMFVTSQKINAQSEIEYRAIQIAQKHMEEIKGMEYLEYSDEAGDEHYDERTVPDENGIIRKVYERLNVDEEDNYTVDIEVIPDTYKEESSGGGEEENKIKKIDITALQVICGSQEITFSGDIDFTIDASALKIEDTAISDSSGTDIVIIDLKELNKHDVVKMNVTNNTTDELQINIINNSEDFEFQLTVIKGKIGKKYIHGTIPPESSANNILYNVIIKVYRDGELVNITEGSTLFVYKPVKV